MADYAKLATKMLGFPLNEDQNAAISEIVEWANQPLAVSPYKTLGGYAGTGKSTIVKVIVSLVSSNTALCAPTNKAVKVLKSLGTGRTCMTIYSLLGLRMSQHEDKLKLEKALKDKVGSYNLIIIDEAGMIGEELLDYIETATKMYGVKVLFVGDPGQLNPIGEDLSEIWGRYPMIILRKVERHDNQILDFATHIRSTKITALRYENNNDGIEGVWDLDMTKFKGTIKDYAAAGSFHGTKSRVLAWRNKTVDEYNEFIRHCIHGVRAKKEEWIEGDRVVFTAPFGDDIITDDEGYVRSMSVGFSRDYPRFKCIHLEVMLNDEYPIIVPIIHPDSDDDYVDELSLISMQARKYKEAKDFKASGAKWKEYWTLVDSFVKIKHGYALTAHRAQGSTYENVFVDVSDILTNSNRKEAKRCLYVTATRPTTRLFLT
jgi:exodeoxyribonuclease-5